ncbi:hypothetical protein [Salmonella sp. NW603]|uniref:hypothetical protein n=1 Tax=Salmonella sp. NW603 TaxID=2948131 RepID=UPI003F420F03
MKPNTILYVALLSAIFLVVSWTATAGRELTETKVEEAVAVEKAVAVEEAKETKEAKVGKDYYGGGGYHCYPHC